MAVWVAQEAVWLVPGGAGSSVPNSVGGRHCGFGTAGAGQAPPENRPYVCQPSTTCCTAPTQAASEISRVAQLSARRQRRVLEGGWRALM